MSSVYSRSELGVMSIAFANRFHVDKEVVNTKTIKEWMESAPRLIVEYDGLLKNETVVLQDDRMRMNEAAYNGSIQELVKHLRRLYSDDPAVGNKPKWELIFHVANEILSVQETIEHATTEALLGSQESDSEDEFSGATQVEQNNEVQQVETSTSTVTTEPEPLEDEGTSPIAEDVVSTAEESPVEVAHEPEVVSSGNVPVEEPAQSLFDTAEVTEESSSVEKSIFMEEKEMADAFEALVNQANQANPEAANPTETQAAPVSNVAGTKDDARFTKDVTALLNEQKGVKKAWSQSNPFSHIVSKQVPAVFRRIQNTTMGRVINKGTAEEDKAAATEKLNSFIVAVTGGKATNATEYAALSNADKIHGLNNPDDAKKAAAMYDLLTKIAQAPQAEYEAYIPASDAVNYPTKGYTLGGVSYPVSQLAIVLMDKSTGRVYAQGYVQPDGNPTVDDAPTLTLGVTKKVEANQNNNGVQAGQVATKQLVVRPKNKKQFLKEGMTESGVNSKVKFLQNTLAYDGEGADRKPRESKASFKALITVDGISMPATLACKITGEDGNFVERSTTKDGTVTYKTKVVSIPVSLPVHAVAPDFEPEFLDEKVDITITYSNWGIKRSAAASKKANGDIQNGSEMPVFDIFAQLGMAGLKQYADDAEIVKAILDKQKDHQEADAAEAKQDLD